MMFKGFRLCAIVLIGVILFTSAISGDCVAQTPQSDIRTTETTSPGTDPDSGEVTGANVAPSVREQGSTAQQAVSDEPPVQSDKAEQTVQGTVNRQTSASSKLPESLNDTIRRPLTRREQRKEEKRLRNMPLDLPEFRNEPFRVSGGQQTSVKPDSLSRHIADSLAFERDSLQLTQGAASTDAGSIGQAGALPGRDSTLLITETNIEGDTLLRLSGEVVPLPDSVVYTRRELRDMRRAEFKADTTLYRHNPYIRDSIPISRMTLISLVAPGFGQFYNQDYWKIPVLYGVVGTSVFLGVKQHQKYKSLKNIYDDLYTKSRLRGDGTTENRFDRELLDPVQRPMIKHNTWRQLFFGAAIGGYIYFLGDGVLNYPAQNTSIKIATTLSTIFPGAGQFYNKSYWRVPIVVGAFASMIYVIDWNSRLYRTYDQAYKIKLAAEANSSDPNLPYDDYNSYSAQNMRDYRDSARRARDLSIILTAALYALNIIDAHVDAHLKDYDVSDDLSWNFRLEPSIQTTHTQAYGTTNAMGLSFCFTF